MSMLSEKMIQLKKSFVEYSDLVENSLTKAKQGLVERKSDLLEEVIHKGEPLINEMEIDIDEMCMSVIAQYQPKAKSLRTIMMISKINSDLERIGDQITNVAQSALYLLQNESFLMMVNFEAVMNNVITMYRNSIQSFIQEDANLARQVLEMDEVVDAFNRDVYHKLKGSMKEDPKVVSPALQIMRIARNIERIADHVTNISEDVVYVVEGRVLKHQAREG